MQKISSLLLMLAALTLLAFCGAGCSPKTWHLSRANKYFAAGEYDKAEIEYINVLRRGSDPFAYKRLGIIYFDQGRLSSAGAFLMRARELATNDTEIRVKLALLYLSVGDVKRARAEATFVLEHKPDDQEAPLVLAEALASQQDVDATRAYLGKLPTPPAQRAGIETALGNLEMRVKNYRPAQAAFERARALDPKFPALYAGVGNWYWSQGDLKMADQMFKKAAELAPPRSSIQLKYAQFKIKTGDLAGGGEILKGITEKSPDYLPAWQALAEVAVGEKKYDEADKALNKVLAADAQNYEALMLSGKLNSFRNDYSKSADIFDRMSKYYPRNPIVFYQLALAYRGNNEIEKAVNGLNEALTIQSNYVDAVVLLDELKIRQGNFESSVTSLKEIIRQQPKNTYAMLILAAAYVQQGKPDQAIGLYDQLEEISPNDSQVPWLKGIVLLRQNKLPQARVEFEKTLKLAPGFEQPLGMLVNLDLADKNYTAALDRLQKQLDANPKAQTPRLLMAKVYTQQGNTNQAEATLVKAIELQPELTVAAIDLAELYEKSGQYDKALATLKQVVAGDPVNALAWMRIGLVQEDQNDVKGARDSYEKVLSINPKFSSALNNLAYLYSEKLEDLDKAYEIAKRLRDLSPPDPTTAPYAADTLGWVLYKKGDYVRALPLLEEAAANLDGVPEIYYHVGMGEYMNGREDAARAHLQSATNTSQTFPGKDQIAASLAVLAIDAKTAGPEAKAMLEKRIAQRPQDLAALTRLAVIYEKEKAADKAAKTYEGILAVNPKNVDALVHLARLDSLNQKDLPKAMDLAKQAYSLAPDNAAASQIFGRLAYLTGNYKRAAAVLEQNAAKQASDPEALYNLALARYSIGQAAGADTMMRNALQAGPKFPHAAEAKQFLELRALGGNLPASGTPAAVTEALKKDPEYVPALMITAAVQEKKSETGEAKKTYEKILNHYPDFSPAKRQLALLYAHDPSSDEKAYQIAADARQAFPDDPQVAKALGILSYRRGDFSRAKQLLNESSETAKNDAELMYYLGMTQSRLKQNTESKKTLRRALELNLPDSLATEAKRVLAELK